MMPFGMNREQLLKLYLNPGPPIDPFEAKGYTPRFGHGPLVEEICGDENPCFPLFTLYARMGLHRYNLLKGTNYQFCCVKKYNYRTVSASPYFITLSAMNPSTQSFITFQTAVQEQRRDKFALACFIARTTEEPKLDRMSYPNSVVFPEWPPKNPFKRFHVVTNSELKSNDWIRLYLELAVATPERWKANDLSSLKILQVAIDTSEGFNAKKATVYIRYKDSCEARVGKDVDRVAMVIRTFDEHTDSFCLVGLNWNSEIHNKSLLNSKVEILEEIGH